MNLNLITTLIKGYSVSKTLQFNTWTAAATSALVLADYLIPAVQAMVAPEVFGLIVAIQTVGNLYLRAKTDESLQDKIAAK